MRQVVLPYTKADGKLYLQALEWPEKCACCGAEATERNTLTHRAEGTGGDGSTYYDLNWSVPYCRTCLKHAKLMSAINIVLIVGGILLWVGIGYGLFLMGLAENIFAIGAFILALPMLGFIGYQLRKLIYHLLASTTPNCTHQGCAIDVTSSGTQQQVKLTFFNDDYASAFISLNQL